MLVLYVTNKVTVEQTDEILFYICLYMYQDFCLDSAWGEKMEENSCITPWAYITETSKEVSISER